MKKYVFPAGNPRYSYKTGDEKLDSKVALFRHMKPAIYRMAEQPLYVAPLPSEYEGVTSRTCPRISDGCHFPDKENWDYNLNRAKNMMADIDSKYESTFHRLNEGGRFKKELPENISISTSNIYFSGNLADAPLVAHEMGHCYELGTHEELSEVASIVPELLVANRLKKDGVATMHPRHRISQVNTMNKKMLEQQVVLDIIGELGIDFNDARKMTMESLIEEYKSKNNLPDNSIVDIVEGGLAARRSYSVAKHFAAHVQENELRQNPLHHRGLIYGSILADKIKRGVLSHEEMRKVLNNYRLSPVQQLEELGMGEMSDELVDVLYKVADSKRPEREVISAKSSSSADDAERLLISNLNEKGEMHR